METEGRLEVSRDSQDGVRVGGGGIGKLLLSSYRAFIGADGKNFKIVATVAQQHEYNQCP